jgi:hypothetical protein
MEMILKFMDSGFFFPLLGTLENGGNIGKSENYVLQDLLRFI